MHCIAPTYDWLDWTDATKVQGSETYSLIFGICMRSVGKLITSALLPLFYQIRAFYRPNSSPPVVLWVRHSLSGNFRKVSTGEHSDIVVLVHPSSTRFKEMCVSLLKIWAYTCNIA